MSSEKTFLEELQSYILEGFELKIGKGSFKGTVQIYDSKRSKGSKDLFEGDIQVKIPEDYKIESVKSVGIINIAYENEAKEIIENLSEFGDINLFVLDDIATNKRY